MSEIITCPSELTGRIRAMSVREERILADRKPAKAGGQVDELLTGADERKLPQLKRGTGDRLLSAMLVFRVSEIECGEAPGPGQLFHRVDLDAWREGVFQVCWGSTAAGGWVRAVLPH